MNQETKEIFTAAILSALLYVAGAVFKPFGALSYFSALPLNVLGFSRGYKAFINSTLLSFAFTGISQMEIDLTYLWFNLMPSLLVFSFGYKFGQEKTTLKFLSRKWDWLRIINVVLVFQFLTLLIGFGVFAYFTGDLPPQIKELQQKLMAQNSANYGLLLSLLPGFMAGSWLLMTFTNLHFAKRWCEKKKRKILWKPQKSKKMPHGWDLVLVVGLMVLVLFREPGTPHYMGKIICSFAFLPLAIQGYFTIYKFFALKNLKPFHYWIFVIVSFMLAWPMIIVVILGFVEPIYKIGNQLDKKQN